MDSQDIVSLAQFCIDQHDTFEPTAWIARGALDGKRVVVAAHYLSMTSWYGHEEDLGRIALRLDPDIAKNPLFERDVRDGVFSLGQFSRMVRHGIALRKLSGDSKPLLAPSLTSGAAAHSLVF